MFGNLNDRQQEIVESYKKYKSAEKVASLYNVSPTCIRRYLKLNNIESVGGNKKRNHILNAILDDYTINKLSVNEALSKYNITKKYFIKILHKKNIEIRDYKKSIFLTPYHINFLNDIRSGKIDNNTKVTIKQLAKEYNISNICIKSILLHYGIDLRKKYKLNKINNNRINVDGVLIDYLNNMLMTDIAKKYATSVYFVKKILVDNSISLRTKSEATKIQNSKYEHQVKSIKNSYKSKKFILPSGNIVKVQGYEDDFLNYVFNNSICLEEDIVFNPPRFKYSKDRYYYPDFYIPKYNLIVEIKSAYTLKNTNKDKLSSVNNTGYNFIIIVDKNYEDFKKFILAYV